MNAAELREAVENDKRTELDRLGSSKLLVALTDAELDESTVLTAAGNSEHAAERTFSQWADDEENDRARTAFEAVAAQERDHYDRVAERLPDEFEPVDGGPMHAYLRGREDAVSRVAGGMVGRPLVSVRTHTQVINFFTNEADRTTADLFRDLKEETRAVIDDGTDLLDELCEDADDWERASATAGYVIQVAYDDYADSLTELGVDPKPLC
ncbi:rubrerythrin family protein [Halostella sp. PRR32]|uniref:rubrerythrin family protein n=1 Tax=Halostella sp. PRR32 TaxID=3098147 RepID=UPI002B1DB84A|nr:rubrerythrin family protein [Halostella sp. PRR32]